MNAPHDLTPLVMSCQSRLLVDWLQRFTDSPRLPATTVNALARDQYGTVGEVNAATDEQLLKRANFGPKSLALWRTAFGQR